MIGASPQHQDQTDTSPPDEAAVLATEPSATVLAANGSDPTDSESALEATSSEATDATATEYASSPLLPDPPAVAEVDSELARADNAPGLSTLPIELAPAWESIAPAEEPAAAESIAPAEEPAPPVEFSAPLAPAEDAAGVDNALPVRPVTRRNPLDDAVAQAEQAADEASAEESQQLAARRGRIELLPNEEIVYHIGALYLTNKRVLLYAPTVLRAAFLRDVDAMGTATERLPGGVFLLGLFMGLVAVATGALLYFDARGGLAADSPLKALLTNLDGFLPLPTGWVALGIGLLGVFFIISYFTYISKSLFVSVSGRPLITVSIGGYRPRRLDDIDTFINALAAAKDNAEE